MKRVWKTAFCAAVVLLSLVFLVFGLFRLLEWIILDGENNWYTTENISDYGQIIHNGNNAVPQSFFQSFFPERIEPYFEDVQYKYQARDWCDYCCEVHLEFRISDTQQFNDYVRSATEGIPASQFAYDAHYMDYTISDELPLHVIKVSSDDGKLVEECDVEGGRMGRILVCEEEQKIIYTMVMVTSCCGEAPESFYFYERFDIDPLAYAQKYSEVRYSEYD